MLRGEPYLLWRAVDQHGDELDMLLQTRRDKASAKRSFKRVLASRPEVPHKIATDQLRSYPAAHMHAGHLDGGQRFAILMVHAAQYGSRFVDGGAALLSKEVHAKIHERPQPGRK